jgi:hypothetical protein
MASTPTTPRISRSTIIAAVAVAAAFLAGVLVAGAGSGAPTTTVDAPDGFPGSSAAAIDALDRLAGTSAAVATRMDYVDIGELNTPTTAPELGDDIGQVSSGAVELEQGVVDFASRSAVMAPVAPAPGPPVIVVDGAVFFDWDAAAASRWVAGEPLGAWVAEPAAVTRSGVDLSTTSTPALISLVTDASTWLTDDASDPVDVTGPNGESWSSTSIPIDTAALAELSDDARSELDDELAAVVTRELDAGSRVVPDGVVEVTVDADGDVMRIRLQLEPDSRGIRATPLTLTWDLSDLGVAVDATAPEAPADYLTYRERLDTLYAASEELTTGTVEDVGPGVDEVPIPAEQAYEQLSDEMQRLVGPPPSTTP